MLAYDSIHVHEGLMFAPRIGFCASDIQVIDSTIHADGKGCTSDEGIGAGEQIADCAGQGASHGGFGGIGGVASVDYKD